MLHRCVPPEVACSALAQEARDCSDAYDAALARLAPPVSVLDVPMKGDNASGGLACTELGCAARFVNDTDFKIHAATCRSSMHLDLDVENDPYAILVGNLLGCLPTHTLTLRTTFLLC